MKRLKVKADGAVRPLEVLVPLIKQEIASGNEATERGMEFYRHAGEMLLEARQQVRSRGWRDWLSENFALSNTTARRWMLVASTEGDFGSQREVERHVRVPSGLPEGIRRILRGLAPDLDELSDHNLSERKENAAMRTLSVQIIDAGYRVMAMKLHPDHGGSNEAMRRLNAVRNALKRLAKG